MGNHKVKVAVGLSGGVDSSVAAVLLKENGYDVIGIAMEIFDGTMGMKEGEKHACYGPGEKEDLESAASLCRKLRIPFHRIDLRKEYREYVINYFTSEYLEGRTPNPCIVCNYKLKFGFLLEKAREAGIDFSFFATGHYARIKKSGERFFLKRASDLSKAQSYFLYALTQEQLRHALFPIEHLTKAEVRTKARERNLPTGSRPESQDICFIPNNDYADFLKGFLPQASEPGPILDEHGNILGRHRGIINYTIGQRKRLGIAAGEPQYVIAIEPEHNAVIVGCRERALGDELVATNVNWSAIDRPTEAITARAKIRYRHPEAEASITPVDKDSVYVKFKEPQPAITPGQSIVFYNGDKVLGGGTIKVSSKLMALEPAKECASNG